MRARKVTKVTPTHVFRGSKHRGRQGGEIGHRQRGSGAARCRRGGGVVDRSGIGKRADKVTLHRDGPAIDAQRAVRAASRSRRWGCLSARMACRRRHRLRLGHPRPSPSPQPCSDAMVGFRALPFPSGVPAVDLFIAPRHEWLDHDMSPRWAILWAARVSRAEACRTVCLVESPTGWNEVAQRRYLLVSRTPDEFGHACISSSNESGRLEVYVCPQRPALIEKAPAKCVWARRYGSVNVNRHLLPPRVTGIAC